MAYSILSSLAAASLAGALLLVLLAPLAEQRVGATMTTGLLLGALLLLLLAATGGWFSRDQLGRAIFYAAGALLGWAVFVHGAFHQRRGEAYRQWKAWLPIEKGAHCTSRLELGAAREEAPRSQSWRSYLYARYATAPSNGELREGAMVWGGVTYILYFTDRKIGLQPTVTIVCQADSNGKCLVDTSVEGDFARSEGCLSVSIDNDFSVADAGVRAVVSMSASLNGSGGPSLGGGAGWFRASLGLLDASRGGSTPMGVYRWSCAP